MLRLGFAQHAKGGTLAGCYILAAQGASWCEVGEGGGAGAHGFAKAPTRKKGENTT